MTIRTFGFAVLLLATTLVLGDGKSETPQAQSVPVGTDSFIEPANEEGDIKIALNFAHTAEPPLYVAMQCDPPSVESPSLQEVESPKPVTMGPAKGDALLAGVLAPACLRKKTMAKDADHTYELKLTIYHGDPFGDAEDGSLEVFADQTLTLHAGEPHTLVCGGPVVVGKEIYCNQSDMVIVRPEPAEGDKIKVMVSAYVSAATEKDGHTILIQKEIETTKIVAPDKPVRVKCAEIAGQLTWLEFQIHRVSQPVAPY